MTSWTNNLQLPQGFAAHVANIGIKDATDDFVVIASDAPAVGAGVFTQSRFSLQIAKLIQSFQESYTSS